jgi:hypothetical protein
MIKYILLKIPNPVSQLTSQNSPPDVMHVLDLSNTNTCEILPGMRPQNETHHLKYRILLKVMFITITLTYNGYVKIR